MFGFTAFNDFGNVLISDKVSSMVYAGEATFVSLFRGVPIGVFSVSTNAQNFTLHTYRYTVPRDVTPMFFCEAVSSYYTGVVQITRSGLTYTVQIISQQSSNPKLHVFIPADPLTTADWGLALFDENGIRRFLSTDNILKPRALYNFTYQASALYTSDINNTFFVGSASGEALHSPTISVPAPILRPAILFHSSVATAHYRGTVTEGRVFEQGIRYLSSGQLSSRWGRVAAFFSNDRVNDNLGAISMTAVVIDIADYI